MNSMIYITIASSHWSSYDWPLIQWVRKVYPEVVIFDFDNHSKVEMADYAIKLIEKSDKVLVVVNNQAEKNATLGGILKVLQYLIRQQTKSIHLFLWGSHPIVEKMGNTLRSGKFYQNFEEKEIKEKISAILSQ